MLPDVTRIPKPRPAAGGVVMALALATILWVVLLPRQDAGSGLEPLGAPPPELDLGTHAVGPSGVTDGDSIRLPDIGAVRVIGVDCEEVFRSKKRRAAAARDFAAYAQSERGDAPLPVKYPTPAGEAAGAAVRAWVAAAGRVRLERDDVDVSSVDAHGRTLAHVVLLAPGGEVLLAEALIAAGHSPYFVKYGRCRRFDRRLRRAEEQARAERLGVWSAGGPDHYPDYEERLRWWQERSDQVDRWRARADHPGHVPLDAADAEARLHALIGQEAMVFGLLRNQKTEGRPRILWLRHAPRRDFAVVFFDLPLWEGLDHEALRSRFVTVTGRVTLHRDRPQILVERATQIGTP